MRRLYPGRTVFTAKEVAFAERALEIASYERNMTRVSSRDVPVGGVFERGGVRYECFVRPPVSEIEDACSGCAFDKVKTCSAPRCSKFDRSDGVSVWFRKVEDE